MASDFGIALAEGLSRGFQTGGNFFAQNLLEQQQLEEENKRNALLDALTGQRVDAAIEASESLTALRKGRLNLLENPIGLTNAEIFTQRLKDAATQARTGASIAGASTSTVRTNLLAQQLKNLQNLQPKSVKIDPQERLVAESGLASQQNANILALQLELENISPGILEDAQGAGIDIFEPIQLQLLINQVGTRQDNFFSADVPAADTSGVMDLFRNLQSTVGTRVGDVLGGQQQDGTPQPPPNDGSFNDAEYEQFVKRWFTEELWKQ